MRALNEMPKTKSARPNQAGLSLYETGDYFFSSLCGTTITMTFDAIS